MGVKTVELAGMITTFDTAGFGGIPASLSQMPVMGFRLLHMPLGCSVRDPTCMGKFAVSKPYGSSLFPAVVHFTEDSGLAERFVLACTTLDLCPGGMMAGVGIMCHEFPLTKAKSKRSQATVYKTDDEAIFMSLEQATSISEVDTSDVKT